MNMCAPIGRLLARTPVLAFAAGLAATQVLAADPISPAVPTTASEPANPPATPKTASPRKRTATPAPAPTPIPEATLSSTALTTVTEVNAMLGKSTLINLERPVKRLSIGNPAVADVILTGTKQIYILGKSIGSTNLMLWDQQGHTAAIIDLNVSREFGALSSEIQRLAPDANVRVRSMGQSIILEGHVPDALTANKASDLAEAFLGKKPVNMLHIDGAQQVMLEVKVAEINRTLVDSLGAKFGLLHASTGGGIGWTLLGDLLSSPTTTNLPSVAPALGGNTPFTAAVQGVGVPVTGTVAGSPFSGTGTAQVPVTGTIGGSAFTNPIIASNVGGGTGMSMNKPGATNRLLNIDMLKQDGLLKVLAEPNIVAMSGQEGGFLAGGEILIPVPQSDGTMSLESRIFGVGLKFTPTVLESGRIHMRVAPEVSDLVGFTNVASTGLGGAVLVPTLSTRRVSTTVELRDGQTLAIGGLLNDRAREQVNRLPLLGEIPILGALFRSSQYQTDRTELVILVTPRLIKPLTGTPPLPTDAFTPPSRAEFFLEGRMEGRKSEQPPPATPTQTEGGHQLK